MRKNHKIYDETNKLINRLLMMVRQKPVGGDMSLINVHKVQHSAGSSFLVQTKQGDNKYLFKFI